MMDRLPQELIDLILQYTHTLEDTSSLSKCSPGASTPHYYRHSSKQLVSKMEIELASRQSCKRFRHLPLLEKFYTCRLFHTVILYPHRESLQRLCAIARSPLAIYVRRIIISLPFFSLTLRGSCGASTIHSIDLADYWHSVPAGLGSWLQSFSRLDSVVILPSWMRRREWLSRHRLLDSNVDKLLTASWFGCIPNHYECERIAEAAETKGLRSMIKTMSKLQLQLSSLDVPCLGTEWLDLAAGDWRRDDVSEFSGLSPRASVEMAMKDCSIRRLAILNCSLHDMVWFTPIFQQLKQLSLNAFQARHTAEVELFAATLNRKLYPALTELQLKSSSLMPHEYLLLFRAIREHRGIKQIRVEKVHHECLAANIGSQLDVCTEQRALNPAYEFLFMYLEGGDQDISEMWLKLFLDTGCPHVRT